MSWLTAATFAFLAQATAPQPAAEPVLTVCEVLENYEAYNGKTVTVRAVYVFGQHGSSLMPIGCDLPGRRPKRLPAHFSVHSDSISVGGGPWSTSPDGNEVRSMTVSGNISVSGYLGRVVVFMSVSAVRDVRWEKVPPVLTACEVLENARTHAGKRIRVRGDWVVDAQGRSSLLSKKCGGSRTRYGWNRTKKGMKLASDILEKRRQGFQMPGFAGAILLGELEVKPGGEVRLVDASIQLF